MNNSINGNGNEPNQDLKSKMHTTSSYPWLLMSCSVCVYRRSHYEIYNSCMSDVLELVKLIKGEEEEWEAEERVKK